MNNQPLLRLRLPLAVITVIGMSVGALTGIVWFAIELSSGFVRALLSTHIQVPSVAVVMLVLLVISMTWVAPVRQASLIAWAGFGLGAAWLLTDVMVALLQLVDDRFGAVNVVEQSMYALLRLSTAIPGLAAVLALGALAKQAPSAPVGYPTAPTGPLAVTGSAQPPVNRPVWQATEATGGAWTRAGDAATGAQASTTGVPGQPPQGWQQGWINAGQAAQGQPQPQQPPPQPGDDPGARPTPQWRPVDPHQQ